MKRRRDEHDRAIRLGQVTESAIARHCRQSGHKFDFDGTSVRDTTSNKRRRLILEAWHVKSWEGGLTGGDGGHTHTIHSSNTNGENWMVQMAG